MYDKKLRRLPMALAAMAACLSAHAEYTSPDGNFRLSGFGTVGAVKTSTDDAVYTGGSGGSATKRASMDPDSRIAVQGSYKFTPNVSATTQVMTKSDTEGQYVPTVEWAFAKWQATPALSVRAGRMGAPFFLVSDFRDVGYANTTVRPSREVYGQVPVSQFEGVDATYQLNVGSAVITSTVWGGQSHAAFTSSTAGAAELTLKGLIGLNVTAELSNGLTLRLGHSQSELTFSSQAGDQLTAAATALSNGALFYHSLGAPGGDQAVAAAASYIQGAALANPVDTDASFSGIGLSYDHDAWIASVEFTKRKTKSFVASTTGWYGTLGYRIGKFTPYVGVSKLKTDGHPDNPVLAANYAVLASPDPFAGLRSGASAFNQGVQGLVDTQDLSERTVSLGVRWEALSNLAVKAQFDRITKPAGSNGLFTVDPSQPAGADFRASKRNVNVLSVAVDFVF